MSWQLPIALLTASAPSLLVTYLAWPAFARPGHLALLGLATTAVVATVVLGVWLLRQQRALASIGRSLERMASGEPVAPEAAHLDATGPAATLLHQLAELEQQRQRQKDIARQNLRGIVDETKRITNTGAAVARGAEVQADSLNDISSAIQEIGSVVTTSADNAAAAKNLARGAEATAGRGTDAMRRMVEAMGEIQASSNEISRIIKVIDDIAFQTNLLALNAAVEAARAGETGKGFAVVAEEVRNLAQRSAEAARNTAELIAAASQRAQRGSQISEEVDGVLREIVGTTTKVSTLMEQIAASTQEQAGGIRQITGGLAAMAQVTETNRQQAEQLAGAVAAAAERAEQLTREIEV
jgi:methyl-accepting chemotaxis protein